MQGFQVMGRSLVIEELTYNGQYLIGNVGNSGNIGPILSHVGHLKVRF